MCRRNIDIFKIYGIKFQDKEIIEAIVPFVLNSIILNAVQVTIVN